MRRSPPLVSASTADFCTPDRWSSLSPAEQTFKIWPVKICFYSRVSAESEPPRHEGFKFSGLTFSACVIRVRALTLAGNQNEKLHQKTRRHKIFRAVWGDWIWKQTEREKINPPGRWCHSSTPSPESHLVPRRAPTPGESDTTNTDAVNGSRSRPENSKGRLRLTTS